VDWDFGLLVILKAVNQILAAGIAITAFSILLYALSFNLIDRVAHAFVLIMACVVVVYTAEAIGSTVSTEWEINFWLHLQWMGIIFLPAAYLHISDALLSTTGEPAQNRRRVAIRLAYLISAIFLIMLPLSIFVGPVVMTKQPAPHLQRTLVTEIFTVYYICMMGAAWYNFIKAYNRTVTPTSRRRMVYLITGAIAPAIGSYPYLLYGSNIAARYPIFFWWADAVTNVLVGLLIVVMTYAVAFFGVPWPDRVVKSRLFKWLMRGPFTASLTLAVVTITRRAGEIFGMSYTAFVPIVMVCSILLFEYLIILTGQYWERKFFHGGDPNDVKLLQLLEERLLTTSDTRQFLEAVTAAICDRLQVRQAFIAALNEKGMELVVRAGDGGFLEEGMGQQELYQMVTQNPGNQDHFKWGNYVLLPLREPGQQSQGDLLGVLGILQNGHPVFEEDQRPALKLLTERAAMALQNRRMQHRVFESLKSITPDAEFIQRLRAASRYDRSGVLIEDPIIEQENLGQWIKDALNHYWGGPKLTESPLINLQIVQDALHEHEGNSANALRAILRRAVDMTRPEGQRRFTGEWTIYNILEMRFIEGRKIREIAYKLALSEADLYRKQRVAIEAVARAITEMEAETFNHKEQVDSPMERIQV
jgi:hypothetical protein